MPTFQATTDAAEAGFLSVSPSQAGRTNRGDVAPANHWWRDEDVFLLGGIFNHRINSIIMHDYANRVTVEYDGHEGIDLDNMGIDFVMSNLRHGSDGGCFRYWTRHSTPLGTTLRPPRTPNLSPEDISHVQEPISPYHAGYDTYLRNRGRGGGGAGYDGLNSQAISRQLLRNSDWITELGAVLQLNGFTRTVIDYDDLADKVRPEVLLEHLFEQQRFRDIIYRETRKHLAEVLNGPNGVVQILVRSAMANTANEAAEKVIQILRGKLDEHTVQILDEDANV